MVVGITSMRSTRSPRQLKQKIPFIFSSIISLVLLAFLVLSLSPSQPLVEKPFTITYLPFGLALLFIFLFATASIFLRRVHGVLIAGFVTTFLLFRLFGLRHPFFVLLLILLFVVLELFFSSKQS